MTVNGPVKPSSIAQKRGGDLRAEFSDLVRTRIRQAASDLFADNGYKATTVRQIARRAGSTHTTFYNYFRSKEEVLYAILGEIGPQVAKQFEKVVDAARDEASFRLWFAGYNAFWLANRGIYMAYWEAMFADPKIAATTRRLMDGITGPLATQLVADSGADAALAAQRLALWLHNIDVILMLAHTPGSRNEAAGLDAAASFLWSSLRDIAQA